MSERLIRVLIVDDDPVDREVFKRYLRARKECAYEFAEAVTAGEVAARCSAFDPHCVLLDYNLPDGNGLEVLRSLAGSDGQLGHPIVMLTGLGNERVAVEAMNAGVMDYASKGSTTAETLHHIIANAMRRFRMERQISAQQQRYRTLVEAIPLMVWSSGPEGFIHFANARWEAFAGERDQSWLDRIQADDRPEAFERWQTAIESGEVFEMEARLLRRDGEFRWHLLRAVPMPESVPEPTWLCIATDTTDQKTAQQALLQQQKLDSIGLLAGGIAHDFNNLLVGIMGGTSFALEAVSRAHPAYPMLRSVLTASERAATLTRQMLAYAGKGQFVIEPIDLSHLVASTSELARTLIPDSVNLHLETAIDLPPMESDAGQIQQVAMNLVMNAVESIPENRKGSVMVRTWFHEMDPAETDVWGQPIAPGPYVALEVSDTGTGMSEEIRSKMFDPFFTTKFMGRGLGLSAVHGIVRSNRGGIQVRSELDAGTTFRIFFPSKAQPALSRELQPEDGDEVPKGTVLVIDDEAMVRKVVQVTLSRDGFQVLSADSGSQALRMMATCPEISAVLLDLNMPDMNGQEVLAELMKHRKDLPVIVCSGFNEEEVHREFQGMELAGVIQKPFTAQQLLAGVREILGRRTTESKGQAL